MHLEEKPRVETRGLKIPAHHLRQVTSPIPSQFLDLEKLAQITCNPAYLTGWGTGGNLKAL